MTVPASTIDTIKARIEESVLNSMGALFPPEEFKELIDKAVQRFFEQTELFEVHEREPSGWNTPAVPEKTTFKVSPFERIVWLKVRSICTKIVDEYFEQESKKIEESMTAALGGDQQFQGRASASIAKMATVIQQVQVIDAINQANTMMKHNIGTSLRQAGVPVNF